MAISDAFDVMTSKRSYKEPYPEDDALKIIRDAVGTQFDPNVYAAFLKALPEIRSIRERFADGANTLANPKEPPHEKDLVCR